MIGLIKSLRGNKEKFWAEDSHEAVYTWGSWRRN